MNIETKYNTGQPVWLMSENKPWNPVIDSIEVTIFQSEKRSVYYSFQNSRVKANEELVFPSKEELLKSL